MAGAPEDHFTDSSELYVLVEGDDWAHVDGLDARPASRTPTRTATPSRTGYLNRHTRRGETLAAQGIPDLQPRSSSQATFAYNWPDEMPADGKLAARPWRRPKLLIWADNAHTCWQLTASRIDGDVCYGSPSSAAY
jgi:hypothetical protein